MSGDGNDGSPRRGFPLPGMAAVCLYLLLLAGVIILGVVRGSIIQNLPGFRGRFHHRQRGADDVVAVGLGPGPGGGFSAGCL